MKAVNRRNFLGGTAGAISGAVLLPADNASTGLNQSPSLEQAAHALHETVGRYSDQHAPCLAVQASPVTDHGLMYAMETLRSCSVDEIQHLLKPLFEGGASLEWKRLISIQCEVIMKSDTHKISHKTQAQ